MNEDKYLQIFNPKIKRWVKIDRSSGKIIAHKKTKYPYKNIPSCIDEVLKNE